MQWAALVAWLITALGGLELSLQWARNGGPSQKEGIRADVCSPTCRSQSSA